MLQDYVETRNGSLPPESTELFGEQNIPQQEHLRQMRGNVAFFAIENAGVPIEQLSKDLSLSTEVLLDDLATDERLIAATAQARERLKSPDIKGVEAHLTNPLNVKTIKWLPAESDGVKLQTEPVTADDMTFEFADLAPLHRVTRKARERLSDEGKLDDLLEQTKKRYIPALERAVKSGQNQEFRPVQYFTGTKDKDRTVKTEFPAYKFGLHGTDNRAILLMLGENDAGRKIYGLAAIYDHEDQDAVLHALAQDNSKKK